MFEKIVANPRLVILLIGLLIVAGLSALKTLPRLEDPRLSSRFAVVKTFWPGASAERVEALVTRKIEDAIREQKDVKNISSNTRAGVSVVQVELVDQVINGKESFTEARQKIDSILNTLPAGTSRPEFEVSSLGAETVIVAINWVADSQPNVSLLGRYAKELESRLRSVPSTDEVNVYSLPQEEILIEVNVVKANGLGLSVAEISQIVAKADAKVSAGELSNDKYRWQLEVDGEFQSLERIKQIPLRIGLAGEGARLRDIATVVRTPKLPASELAIIDGKQAVVVGSKMGAGVRIEVWRNNVQQIFDQFEHELPVEVALTVQFDQIGYTQTRLAELVGNIGVGFIIILLVLFVTLGWRASLIVAASLPLTIFFTLYCLKLYGMQIHQMSVTGLVVSLGIMVDNAIVMTDSVAQNRRLGLSAFKAIKKSLSHLKVPLLGSTLTTILAFSPIALMPGAGGEFVGPIALAVMFSLIGSYLISFTLVAGVAGRWLPATSPDKNLPLNKQWFKYGIEMPNIAAKFSSSLRTALIWPGRTIAGVVAISFCGYFGATFMTTSFFPPADRDMFQIQIYMPPDVGINVTREVAEKIAEDVKKIEGIEYIDWYIGNGAPSFYYNLFSGSEGMTFYAQAMVKASGFKESDRAIHFIQRELNPKYPTAQVMAMKLQQGPPVNAPVEFRIYGPNLDTLKELSNQVRLAASQVEGVLASRATIEPARKKLWVNLSEDKMAKVGMSLSDASRQFQAALVGVIGGSVIEGGEDVPVRTRIADQHRGNYNHILSGYLMVGAADSRTMVPLSALGDASVKPDSSGITRRNGQRISEIHIFPVAGVLPQSVLTAVMAQLDNNGFTVPAGYELGLGGEADGRSDTMNEMMVYVNVIVALLIMVVALSFNSFRLTAVVFSVAILSVGLGLLSVFLAGYSFGFIIIVALMGLMGLAINASIVILAEFKNNAAACRGNTDAIIECVISCCRHIVSTTLTTVGGLIPLMFSVGLFWPPFAITIIGGTVLTTLISLYFVPAIFIIMAKSRRFDPVIEPLESPIVPI
jgi:multidrug efflux pump subunit AcrB